MICIENATNRLVAHSAQPFAQSAVKSFFYRKGRKGTAKCVKMLVFLEVPLTMSAILRENQRMYGYGAVGCGEIKMCAAAFVRCDERF